VLFAIVGTAAALYVKGYRVWVVHTGSMEPTYMPGDVIIDAPPTGDYHAGEVLTFRHSDLTSDVVTHRVIAVTAAGTIHTKGDANRSADVWDIRPDQVQGRTIGDVKYLGYALVFLRQPTGSAALATVIFAIVMLWQLFFPASARPSANSKRRHALADARSAPVT
jgi:signal peptidase